MILNFQKQIHPFYYRLCPLFKPFLEAIQKDMEDKKQQEWVLFSNNPGYALFFCVRLIEGYHISFSNRLKKEEDEKANLELQNRIQLEKQKQQSNKLTEEQQV